MSHPKNSSIFKIPFLETLFFSNSKLTKLFELYSPGSEKKQRMKRTNPVRGLNNPDIRGPSRLRLSEFVQISEFFSIYITDICQTSESFPKSVNLK